ncbi:hypothetical protein [Thalassovita mangrovi]|uniref:Type I secretion protein n=1 Tax=Thalassovita mangrovi TaxID=2692236 RepID=A0A6L8LQX2_9RHOB|nr:hypothetical protein [Thalassovita mangrovi]MYM57506.1 hypothetical protein [Thalassovita mangrovi]
MDKTTESIAYFIGLFHLASETAASRTEYSSFKYFHKKQSLDPLNDASVSRDVIYGPEGYDPQAGDPYPGAGPGVGPAVTGPAGYDGPGYAHVAGPGHLLLAQPSAAPYQIPGNDMPQLVQAPPPGSNMRVTQQDNTLTDRDTLDLPAETAQAFVQAQGVVLADLQGQAAQLQVLGPMPAGFVNDPEDGMAAAKAAAVFDAVVARAASASAAVPEAEVHLATGAGVAGGTVNGGAATDMPLWQEALPEPLQQVQGDGTGQGHVSLATGGNLALNEVVSVGGGVDAPVIAVGGDVVSFDAISQINVLRDEAAQPEADNELTNAAQFSGQPTVGEAPAMTGPSFLPDMVTMATIEGDLINYDWVHQFNRIGDEDAVSVTVSGSQSYISLGENQAINSAVWTSYGQAYDLIVVDGDFISTNAVSQINILLDQDEVLTPWQDQAGDSVLSGSGNALVNSASITHSASDHISALTDEFRDLFDGIEGNIPDVSSVLLSGLFAPQEVFSVLHITGDLLNIREVTQVNVLSDSDLIELPAGEDAEAGQAVSSGDNAAVNVAVLADLNLPSHVMTDGAVFSDAVLYQANLISDDAPPANVMLAANPDATLASEAVAFLADGMLETQGGDTLNDPTAALAADDGPPHLDVMQTMLA